jgi:hypothetical protein
MSLAELITPTARLRRVKLFLTDVDGVLFRARRLVAGFAAVECPKPVTDRRSNFAASIHPRKERQRRSRSQCVSLDVRRWMLGVGCSHFTCHARPHPNPLPQEREQSSRVSAFRARIELAAAPRIAKRRRTILPLPGGEGRGDGGRFNHLIPAIQNIQHPTSNAQPPRLCALSPIGCSRLDVGCWMFPE